jgi:hypothetical protein
MALIMISHPSPTFYIKKLMIILKQQGPGGCISRLGYNKNSTHGASVVIISHSTYGSEYGALLHEVLQVYRPRGFTVMRLPLDTIAKEETC